MLRCLLFFCVALALLAQTPKGVGIKVSTTTPRANETVILEVVGIAQGAKEKIYWLDRKSVV